MSTFDYTAARAVALELLELFGKATTLERAEDGATYNPGPGTWTGGSTTTLSGVGVVLDYEAHELKADDVLATDKVLYFQGDELQVGDMRDGWRAHKVKKLDPDESGATILATVQLRQ